MSGGELLAGGLILGAVGDIGASGAAQAAGEYNADVAKENQKLVATQTAQKRRAARQQGLRDIGSIETGVAKSGVTMEGSPEDAIALATESIAEAEAAIELEGLTAQRNLQAQADLQTMGVEASRRALPFQLGGRALMAAGALSG